MYLLQSLIIFAVVASNIHWHWTEENETVRHRNQIWHGCGQQNAGAVLRVAQRDAKQVLE